MNFKTIHMNLISFLNFTEKCLGLHYTTSMIKYHRKTQGFDTLCKPTVNITFNII